MYFLLKVGISAVLIAAVSELAKRNTLFGAVVASLPLTSLLAMIWLYQDTKNPSKVAALSGEIFWLVLPSLLLFALLPVLLRRGVGFYAALAAACGCTVVAYAVMSLVLQRFGARI